MARVAPEPESEEQSEKSAKSSKISNTCTGFENPELSSAITGKVIEPNDTLDNLQLSHNKQSTKSSNGTSRKRMPRSVSEVVEEKEKQEKTVISRFAIGAEVDIFKCRCSSCFRVIRRYLTCKRNEEEE